MDTITYGDFRKADIRLGVVEDVQDFPQAKKPAYKLKINFGQEIGTRWSSAQITAHHTKEQLLGLHVLCVVNFPPKKVGPFTSEVLTLGVAGEKGGWILVAPSVPGAILGSRLE
ncbi:MAG TPA: tRNA-binding protein [Patescibacteria group bacterium]|nr:tRNA-binding protein [Patescibacteria group bacterium]